MYCLLRLRVEDEREDWGGFVWDEEGGWEVDEGRFGAGPPAEVEVEVVVDIVVEGVVGRLAGVVCVGRREVCWWFWWLEGGRLGATRYRAIRWFYECKAK